MSLFLLAFVQLRRAEPHTPRPFRMPGGQAVLCLAVASPLCFILANLIILLLEPAHGAPCTPPALWCTMHPASGRSSSLCPMPLPLPLPLWRTTSLPILRPTSCQARHGFSSCAA